MMISKSTIWCLALLASTAACSSGGGGGGTTTGGGGGGGAGGTAATNSNGGTSTSTTAVNTTMPASGAVIPDRDTNPGTGSTMSNVAATMTSTSTLTGTGLNDPTGAINIAVQSADGSVNYTQTFSLNPPGDITNDFHGFNPAGGFFSGGTFTDAGGNPQNLPNFATVSNNTVNSDGSLKDGNTIIFDPSLTASTYGIWEHTNDNGSQVGAFAVGTLTPASAIPTSGSASYSGHAIAEGTNGTTSFGVLANFNGSVNFANMSLTGSATQSLAQTFNPTAGTVANQENLTDLNITGPLNALKVSGWSGTTGAIVPTTSTLSGNGQAALFGATGPQEIGGTFAASDGGKVNVVGAFGGKQH
jgi:hypothetical protein